jgi:hypothetical protein
MSWLPYHIEVGAVVHHGKIGPPDACVASWIDFKAASRRSSHEHAAAIDSQHLAGAVGLPHQIKIGFGDLLDLADMSDGKLRCGLTIERVAIGCCHISPERALHHAGRDEASSRRSMWALAIARDRRSPIRCCLTTLLSLGIAAPPSPDPAYT